MRCGALVMTVTVLVGTVAVNVAALPPLRPTAGGDEIAEREYRRLIGELMSPFCHGLTLENCPTGGAADMRERIREQLLQGLSSDEVVEQLVQEWGEGILGAPRFHGLGVLAWILPAVALVLAATTLALWLRRHAGEHVPGAASPPPGEGHAAAARDRVEQDLEALSLR